MATGEGLRYAINRLPLPGGGITEQDRYILSGVVQPADSITPPTIGGDFESKQRARIANVIVPDNVLDDQQDRYHLAGVIQPTLANVNISAQQRAYIANVRAWAGGTGFTENDRAHITGIYPYNEESLFIETFDVSYTLTPTWTDNIIGSSADGALQAVFSPFISGLKNQIDPNVFDVTAKFEPSIQATITMVESLSVTLDMDESVNLMTAWKPAVSDIALQMNLEESISLTVQWESE